MLSRAGPEQGVGSTRMGQPPGMQLLLPGLFCTGVVLEAIQK